MIEALHLILESAQDDWISDYDMQGTFQAQLSQTPSEAFESAVTQATDWIRGSVLVPGDLLLEGFVPWRGANEELAARFAAAASAFHALTQPGQICWFDTGQNAAREFARLESTLDQA